MKNLTFFKLVLIIAASAAITSCANLGTGQRQSVVTPAHTGPETATARLHYQ